MNYFIFNNINSSSFNSLIVNELPNIVKPTEKIDRYEIPNSNGSLINPTGCYETTIKSVECTIRNLNEIDKLLNWLRGSGNVTFSNQPDRVYKATIINKIEFSRLLREFRKFIIEFECQPHALLNNGQEIITLYNSSVGLTIENLGTVEAEPVITIYGNGNIEMSVGSYDFTLTDVVDYITVDVALLEVYKDNQLQNRKFKGKFPIIEPGFVSISWSGSVTKVEIKPNWRCL